MSRGPGRPSKRDGIDLEQVEKLARKGWTDLEMAEFFGMDVRTWYRWKGSDPEFCQALKEWKDEADSRVERSLYERANGYSHPAVKIFLPGGAEKPVVVDYVEHYPPDTTAAIFWLKNRKPEEWRDKQDVEHTGKNGGAIEHSITLTPEDAYLRMIGK
jgi:hypothetical protein